MTSQEQERMELLLKMMYSLLCLKVNKVQVHHHQFSIHQLNNKHHHNQCNKPSKVCLHYSYKRLERKKYFKNYQLVILSVLVVVDVSHLDQLQRPWPSQWMKLIKSHTLDIKEIVKNFPKKCDGFYTEEIRNGNTRSGFQIRTLPDGGTYQLATRLG